MKTFYTERDIEALHAQGVTAISIDDDVVLTDLAREKAIVLGVQLRQAKEESNPPQKQTSAAAAASAPASPAKTASVSARADSDLASQVKSAVVARLGTTEHNGLLDQIIPQVLARLNVPGRSGQTKSGSGSGY